MKRDDVREAPAAKGHGTPTPATQSSGQQELNEKVARLCPFVQHIGGGLQYVWTFQGECIWFNPFGDLNACAEFEKDAPIGYWRRLGDITGAGGHSITFQQWKRIGLATCTERCRAYIYEMEGRSE